MGRPLRYAHPGGLYEVTTRAMQGRYLLAPTAELNELVLGVLGRALARYPLLLLHALIFMSNHYELLLTAPDSHVLAEFMCFVNANIAKEAGRLYGWKDKFWSRRYRAIPVLDEASQVDRLRYLLSNGCKEGLVASPGEWPGASCLPTLLHGHALRGVWFDRTAEFHARQRGEEYSRYDYARTYPVPLAPLPCWAHLSADEQRRRCAELVAEIEAETRTANRELRRKPVGPAALRRKDPHFKPEHCNHTPAPPCHASSRERRLAFREAYREFAARFRRAAVALASGVAGVLFPDHCFPPARPYLAPAPG